MSIIDDAVDLLVWAIRVALVFLIFLCFYVIGNVYINPNADLRLTPTTDAFEYTGFPFSITGTYYETDDYYVLKPNPVLTLGVNPVCYVQKLDKPYINLVGYPGNQCGRKFVDKDELSNKSKSDNKPTIVHQNGVITFVPSTG